MAASDGDELAPERRCLGLHSESKRGYAVHGLGHRPGLGLDWSPGSLPRTQIEGTHHA